MTAFRILEWGADDLPVVACLHDLRGHARRFERLARMLEKRRHVIAYDLRGHGRSPWSGPHTVEQHLADLDDVLEASGVDQCGLIGEGFGGRVALRYATEYQERITSLVLLDPPLFPPPARMQQLAAEERRGGAYDSVDQAIEKRRAQDGLHHTPRFLLEEEMAEHLVADEDAQFRYRYSREAAAAGLEAIGYHADRLRDILCPTLIVHGESSDMLTEADADLAAEEIRRCRVATVPGGHAVLWDALAETGSLVADFVTAKNTA
ncbi:MAG: alpha/beta fold hydrolase [Gaiellales bacterium]